MGTDAHPMRVHHAMVAGAVGFWLYGSIVCHLTLNLNPHLLRPRADGLLLAAYLLVGLGLLGAGLGLVVGLGLRLGAAVVRRVNGSVRSGSSASRLLRLRGMLLTWLVVTPVLGALLLPDVGLAGRTLTDLLFTDRVSVQVMALLGLALVSVGVAAGVDLIGRLLLGGVASRLGIPDARMAMLGAVVLGAAAAAATQLPVAREIKGASAPRAAEASPTAEEPTSVERPQRPPAPVVLLCVDGADLDDVILPMIDDGELPAFARMRREGSWGRLASLQPGLSAVLWTTIATGRAPEDHGIRHFVAAHLPGMRQVIYRFPLHTGLNFHLLGLVERLVDGLSLRVPYTSDMRRVRALWSIVGEHYPVGVYHWLVSWPPEKVNGFNVAESVVAGLETRADLRQRMLDAAEGPSRARIRSAYPPGLFKGYRPPPPPRLTRAEAARFVDSARLEELDEATVRFLAMSGQRGTLEQLLWLRRRFNPVLLMASFYPVDGFNHRFGADWPGRGGLASALAERYRDTDRRLGELMTELGPATNLIVVSDHGYDFEHNHHTYGPDGIFFGIGPAFPAGREVKGLSIFDIVPLGLRLLDLPLAEDMPGTLTGRYVRALRADFIAAHPERRVASYEPDGSGSSAEAGRNEPRMRGDEAEIRKQLQELGYIE